MTRAAPAPHARSALALAALGLAAACAHEPARVSGTVEPRRGVIPSGADAVPRWPQAAALYACALARPAVSAVRVQRGLT